MVIETNITKMFGVKNPILNAPMGPFLTNEISVAVCEAGGLGVVSHTAGLEARKLFYEMLEDPEKQAQYEGRVL